MVRRAAPREPAAARADLNGAQACGVAVARRALRFMQQQRSSAGNRTRLSRRALPPVARPLKASSAPHVLFLLAVALCLCSPCAAFLCCTADNLALTGCSAVVTPNSQVECAVVNDLVLATNTVLNPPIGA